MVGGVLYLQVSTHVGLAESQRRCNKFVYSSKLIHFAVDLLDAQISSRETNDQMIRRVSQTFSTILYS